MRHHVRRSVISLLAILSCLPAVAQTPARKNVELKIEKITPTSSGFAVLVSVNNAGDRSVFLAEGGWKPGALQSLNIQLQDPKFKWGLVGPCRDIPALTTFELKPGERTEDVVFIGDKAHGWRASSACAAEPVAHLRGQVRAVLYVYDSEEQFRQHDPKAQTEIVSDWVQLPPKQ
jgi:hypothetical protein